MSAEEINLKDLMIQHMSQSTAFQNEMREAMNTQNTRLTRQGAHLRKLNTVLMGDSDHEVDGIVQKMDKMDLVICGDERTDTDGLVQKVKKHGAYISSDRKFKWTIAGIFTGGFGGIIAYIKNRLDLQ